ncbi:MAG TPA: DUF4136 domain-containing protein [Candidatus Acidoferrales bacterium]|nr:DUF4136 domain-containing protein [Candidatus Acidoferrales bacterium]
MAQKILSFTSRNIARIAALAAFALLFSSMFGVHQAAAQKITVQFDQDADFSHFKTFTIMPGRLSSKSPALNSDLVRKRIDDDIIKALEKKGLEHVADHADLNVVYRLGADRRTQVEAYPAGWRGWNTRYVRVPYAEGTLVIDLRSTASRSLVWRGIAEEQKSDATKLQGKLDDMVKKSFDKYPPKSK